MFGTFSCAERTWVELAEQIFQTIPTDEKIRIYKSSTFEDLSLAMRERMISDNFILLSHHFHRKGFRIN